MIWLFIVRISSLAVRNFQEANTDTRINSFQMWGKLAIQELYHGFTIGLTNSRSVTIIINSHFMAISCLSLCLLTAKLIQSTRDNVKGCRWFKQDDKKQLHHQAKSAVAAFNFHRQLCLLFEPTSELSLEWHIWSTSEIFLSTALFLKNKLSVFTYIFCFRWLHSDTNWRWP